MAVSTGPPRPPPRRGESGRALPKLILAAALLPLAVALVVVALSIGGALALFTDTDSVPGNTFTTSPSFPPIYYFHSETTTISGTNYYQLKEDTPPDGTATTISSVFSAGQTGRVSPASNNGKFVYPLTGVSEISASTWNVAYRVKRDSEWGFVWFTNANDISLSTTGSWQDIDLSPYLPVGTTGAIVELVNTSTGSAYSGVVRGKEDTRDYMSNASFEDIRAGTHRYQIVKVDSNRLLQGYIENVQIDFKLLGYTQGSDPAFFANPPDITPGTTGAWTPVDVSAYVDADADGVVLLVDSISSSNLDYAIREVGSSFNTPRRLEGFTSTMWLVGLDGADQFEAYIQGSNVKIYLVGQTKGSVVYYTNDIAVTDPTTGSWQEIDADTYSVPAAANGLIFRIDNSNSNRRKIGLRHGDSTDDWNADMGGITLLEAAAGLRDDNVWDEYMQATSVNVSIAAYTRLGRMDVHADMDVLIRKADGTIRTTFASNVANTANITDTAWQSFTGTYAFPGYTVVDQTDYLEIDLFAEATSNSTWESVSVDFRIDDGSLPAANQMRFR